MSEAILPAAPSAHAAERPQVELQGNVCQERLVLNVDDPSATLPTHRLSGLPLIVLPTASPDSKSALWHDYDHQFYIRSSPHLQGVAGQAVRYVRGQQLPRWLHKRKHDMFPHGPQLPETGQAKFTSVMLACAGYVPLQALHLASHNTFQIVEIGRQQLPGVVAATPIHHQKAEHPSGAKHSRSVIGKFLAYHVIEQSADHVGRHIDEFLHTNSPALRAKRGDRLLNDKIRAALGPLEQLRPSLQEQNVVQLRPIGLYAALRSYFPYQRNADYYDEMQKHLLK